MPTEQSHPVSRRKLGIMGVLAGIALVVVVITGISAREQSDEALRPTGARAACRRSSARTEPSPDTP